MEELRPLTPNGKLDPIRSVIAQSLKRRQPLHWTFIFIVHLITLTLCILLALCDYVDLQTDREITIYPLPHILNVIISHIPRFLLIFCILFIAMLQSSISASRPDSLGTYSNLLSFVLQILHLPILEECYFRNHVYLTRPIIASIVTLVNSKRLLIFLFGSPSHDELLRPNPIVESIRRDQSVMTDVNGVSESFVRSESTAPPLSQTFNAPEMVCTRRRTIISPKSLNITFRLNEETEYIEEDVIIPSPANSFFDTLESQQNWGSNPGNNLNMDGTICNKIDALRLDDTWHELPFLKRMDQTVFSASGVTPAKNFFTGFWSTKSYGNLSEDYWRPGAWNPRQDKAAVDHKMALSKTRATSSINKTSNEIVLRPSKLKLF